MPCTISLLVRAPVEHVAAYPEDLGDVGEVDAIRVAGPDLAIHDPAVAVVDVQLMVVIWGGEHLLADDGE
jgi:hypothetical protein